MTSTSEPNQQRRDQEEALDSGAVFQDAEGRRTTNPQVAAEHADSEADRNAEHLERGEVGRGIPAE